jgi:dUTP pyrophosphatase
MAADCEYGLRVCVDDDSYLDGRYADSVANHPKSIARGDAGFDLILPEDHTIPAGKWGYLIDLKVKCEMLCSVKNNQIVRDHNVSYDLRARSSISKTPLVLANSIGTIDAGYRGNIKAAVHNFSSEDVVLKQGERYFQIVAPSLKPFGVSLSFDLSSSARGEGGFGSTGK